MGRQSRRLALGLGAVIALVAFGGLTVAILQSQERARDNVIERFDDRSEIASQLLAGSLRQSITQSQANAQTKLAGAHVDPATLRKVTRTPRSLIPEVALFDDTGKLLASDPARTSIARSAAGQRMLESALAGRAGISGVIENGGTRFLEFDVPFDAGAHGRRVLISSVPLKLMNSYFGGTLTNAAGTEKGGAFVTDLDGHIVAATGAASDKRNVARGVSAAVLDGRSSGLIGQDKYTIHEVADLGMMVAVVAPERELIAELPNRLWPRLALVGFALALLAVFVLIGRVIADALRVEAARVEAERANEAKTRFLSHITHELKQPLATIMGFSELLHQHDDISDSDRQTYLGIIADSGRNLETLVNELLDISRIESGRVMLSIEPVEVQSVVHEVLTLVEPLTADHHITLAASDATPEPATCVLADPMRLRQILLNLVSNAIKYNREGGSVTILVDETAHGTVRVAVVDEGQGISQENIARLFHPFERLQANRGIEGTGLGLVITKGLVTAMDGTLEVASEVGTGSTFAVELPAANTTTEPDDAVGTDSDIAGDVLYIEHDAEAIQHAQGILERARPGITLRTARRGQSGIDLAESKRPDLLLLDLNLTDITGEQVLRQLRSTTETAEVPVVVLSGDSSLENVSRLLKTGADAHLAKPLDASALLNVVDSMLTTHRPHFAAPYFLPDDSANSDDAPLPTAPMR